MQYNVSITSQGQITIPSAVRKKLNIKKQSKGILSVRDKGFYIKPVGSFWDIPKMVKTSVRLTNVQLRKARDAFETDWAER